MDHEQAFFFQVLQDYLHGSVTAKPQEAELSKVFTWAEKHKLSAIFFIQCEHFLKPDTSGFQRLHRSFGAAVAQYVARQQAGAKFRTAMDAASLPYLPIKGPWVGEAYPHPQLRTMSDLDFLVRAEDAEQIRNSLISHGFENTMWSETGWDYTFGQTLFELHTALLHSRSPETSALAELLEQFREYVHPAEGSCYELEPTFHFLFLIAHLATHLRYAGVGYRQFYDLAVVMERGNYEIDWARLREQTERIGFFKFVQLCLALNQRWFGTPSPYDTELLTDEFFDRITEKIFADGVFGGDNVENRNHNLRSARKVSPMPLPLLKLKTAARLAFPPYRELITLEKYRFLRGKPWLTPVAWIYRIVRSKRKKSRKSELAAVLTTKQSDLDKRDDLLKELGL